MRPPNVDPSERSFSPQTVCVWNSGLFAARALKPEIPGTYAEVLALAADSGVPGDLWKKEGQANFTKLAAGMKKRYGLVGQVVEGPTAQLAVLEAAAAGPVVVCLAGNQLNLTPHWQNVSIGHAIAVLYEKGTTGVQFDPLAPAGYAGDSFSPSELAKFATAALIFKEEAADMPPLKTYAPALISLGGAPLINGNVPIREAPNGAATVVYALAPGQGFLTTIGTVGTTGNEWYVYWDVAKGKWLYVNYTNIPIRIPLEDASAARAAGIKDAAKAAESVV